MTDGSAKRWSLRRRLTRRVLAYLALGWLATLGLSALVLNHEMNEMFDEELQALAETTVLFLDASGTTAIPRSVGVETSNGQRVLRILADNRAEPAGPWPPLTRDGFSDVGGWRILRISAEDAVIEVAHSNAARHKEILETAASFLVLVLPLVGLVIWGLWRGLAQAFAPMERLAHSMVARRPDDLSPISALDVPRELQPLVTGLNSYIGRIDALRQAERRFSANAAHELRTPLAAIRARLDLSHDPDVKDSMSLLDALTRRVERLLQLSRSESGLGLGTGPADVVQVLTLLIDEARRHTDRPIQFDDSDLDQLLVPVDVDALAILLRNLLENATDHGTGPVHIRLKPDASLTFVNPTDADAFDDAPFRKGVDSNGAGLGLSIVATLAKAMNVQLDKSIANGKATVTLRFTPLD
ncbi:MAG: sensor histidine kinase [Paracoccaceae bacterium]